MSPLLSSILLEVLARAVGRGGNEIKGIHIGKEEVNLSLFADGMLLYRENSKESIKKALELINTSSKLARYKINIQKATYFHTRATKLRNNHL